MLTWYFFSGKTSTSSVDQVTEIIKSIMIAACLDIETLIVQLGGVADEEEDLVAEEQCEWIEDLEDEVFEGAVRDCYDYLVRVIEDEEIEAYDDPHALIS